MCLPALLVVSTHELQHGEIGAHRRIARCVFTGTLGEALGFLPTLRFLERQRIVVQRERAVRRQLDSPLSRLQRAWQIHG